MVGRAGIEHDEGSMPVSMAFSTTWSLIERFRMETMVACVWETASAAIRAQADRIAVRFRGYRCREFAAGAAPSPNWLGASRRVDRIV
jgi:hypothetical protein